MQARGFTLIEMMVVLLIIGVMTTTISFSLRPDFHRQLDDESYRLARLLEQAVDAAEMGEPLALDWRADGYRWRVLNASGGWQGSGDEFFRAHLWPDGMGGAPLLLDEKKNDGPVLLWQDGRAPAMTLTLNNESGERSVRLSPVGRVSIENKP